MARSGEGVGLGSWSHDYVMRTAWRQLSTVLCVSPSRLCHRDPCDVVGEEPQVMSAVACLRRRRALLSKRCLISWVLRNLLCFLARSVGLDRPCLALGVCEPVTARRCRRSVGTVSGGGGGEAHLEGGSSPASHVEVRWHTVRSGESWRRALASAHRVPRETEKACGPGVGVRMLASQLSAGSVLSHCRLSRGIRQTVG